MLKFLGTLVISIILTYAFLFFGGVLIFENFFALIVFIGLIVAILVSLFSHLLIRVEDLEERIKQLESPAGPEALKSQEKVGDEEN